MSTDTRRAFHEQLEMLEVEVLSLGGLAERALGDAVRSLVAADPELAEKVISGDDEIDRLYLLVEEHALQLLALQSPVAADLRLVSAILHADSHLERIGDVSVNIAKLALATHGLRTNERILSHLATMASTAREMIRAAVEAFARRDLELALRLQEMDEPIDLINRGMYKEVAACGGDPELLEWAVRMMIVSRQIERAGDHAVDIAEQVAFLLTGEFREFTDASHS